jgi:hypothetical protein
VEGEMTHTLHRTGDADSLHTDFVLLVLPDKYINAEGAPEKMRQFWDLFFRHGGDIVNYGNCSSGNSHKFSMADLKKEQNQILNVVFKDRDGLKACLQEIKDRDFGISIIVSGQYEEVRKICHEIGLAPHSVGVSLGFHGRTEKLPDKTLLDITTMCGHHMISHNLVAKMLDDISGKKITCEEAATELSKQCVCGSFNSFRAEQLLRKNVKKESGQGPG